LRDLPTFQCPIPSSLKLILKVSLSEKLPPFVIYDKIATFPDDLSKVIKDCFTTMNVIGSLNGSLGPAVI
jgi:hypothetical protein